MQETPVGGSQRRLRQSLRPHEQGADAVGVGPLRCVLEQDRHESGFGAWVTVVSTESAYGASKQQAHSMTDIKQYNVFGKTC